MAKMEQNIMDKILQNKRILVLVSGGIAIYKILDLISLLKKSGAFVRVVMSDNAMKFIQPLCFEAMSGDKVLCSATESWESEDSPNHINYARWANIALLAPASVNSIAKLRYGIADSLVISTLIATKCPILIAPSANTNMIESAQNIENLAYLSKLGYHIIPTRVTRLACNITSNGAMATINEIVFWLKRAMQICNVWNGQHIVISGGGSIEQIDPIRHISNNSSGKQASYLALALYYLGASVTFISSKFPISLPLEIDCINASSAISFKNAIFQALKEDSILIMSAAISDFVPKNIAENKLKKENLGNKWNLELIQNEDILSQVKCAFKVGFKAESDKQIANQNAKKLLTSIQNGGKGCDMVVLNILNEYNKIGGDENEVIIFKNNKQHNKVESIEIPKSDKFTIATQIIKQIECLFYILESKSSQKC